MSGQKKQTLLAMEIAESLHGTAIERRASRLFRNSTSRQLLLTSIALVALQPGSAEAVAIGDLKVHSALGQPFLATATARISAGEMLAPGCVTAVAEMPGGNATPVTLKAAVAETSIAGEYPVRISSSKPFYEPMYEIRLNVGCSGAAVLAKNYVVMLNVGMAASQTQTPEAPASGNLNIGAPAPENRITVAEIATSTAAAPTAQAIQSDATNTQALSLPDSKAAGINQKLRSSSAAPAESINAAMVIPAGGNYRVQRGETLSAIAQRIEAPAGLSNRQTAKRIFQANPSAFIAANPDLIKMGFVLTVPTQQELLDVSQNRALLQSVSRVATNELSGTKISPAAPASQIAFAENTRSQADVSASGQAVLPAETATIKQPNATAEQPPISPTKNAAISNAPDSPAQASAESAPVASSLSADEASDPTVADQTSSAVAGASTAAASAATQNPAGGASEAGPKAAQESLPVPAEPPAQNMGTTSNSAAEPNELVAAGSGILVGGLLAALILGRGLIASWMPGRLRKPSKQAMANHARQAETLVSTELVPVESPSVEAQTTDGQPDPETTGLQNPQHSLLDGDFVSTDKDADADSSTSSTIDTAATPSDRPEKNSSAAEFNAASSPTMGSDTVPPVAEAPRVSLHEASPDANALDFDMTDMEEPLENTRRYSNPSELENADLDETAELPGSAELDGTGTMHNLFGSADAATGDSSELDVTSTMHDIFGSGSDPLADSAKTEDIASLDDGAIDTGFPRVSLDDTASLQSLSESLANGNPDDDLSKTLTQALGLLEQDYEDELTSSQILEQKDIQKAFAEQAAKES